ncbi:MAG TPA: glycosyltransferase [Ferruginibacter sp.]|nr:glycosyltransferase [Ferruginibacter sp.]
MKFSEILQYWPIVLFAIFCLAALIQVFYYVYFFTRLIYYKPAAKTTSQTHPVSIIICAKDESLNIAKNLKSVLEQEYKTTHEVIVVDDNSFDDTRYLLKTFEEKYIGLLKVLELKQEAQFIPGKKFPLSMGIKAAKYEIVLLTDADCSPASALWLDKIQATYDDATEIVLGYGAFHKKPGLLNKIIRWETFHTALQYFNYTLAGIPYMGVGRNLSYKKVIFFRHKGFSAHNNILSGDDDLFINMAATKTNTKINVDKDTFTYSEPVKTFGDWIRQKNRHYSSGRYYKGLHKFLLGLYSFSHFIFYPLFIVSLLSNLWIATLIIFGVRFILQGIVLFNNLKKLDEKDLFVLFPFFDVFMFFYYIIFSVALLKKPKKLWK